MFYKFLADAVVAFHFTFVTFVLTGGLLVLWRRRAAWFHLPAAAWGVFVEWSGVLCPLTYLEDWLRTRAGTGGYEGSFIDHYIMPVLYPAGLTRGTQLLIGSVILIINVTLYAVAFTRRRNPAAEPAMDGTS